MHCGGSPLLKKKSCELALYGLSGFFLFCKKFEFCHLWCEFLISPSLVSTNRLTVLFGLIELKKHFITYFVYIIIT